MSSPAAAPVSTSSLARAPASTSSKKPASKTKKPASKPKAAAKSKVPKAKATKVSTTTSRPTWKDIIKECIAAHKEDARQGVSRNTIKRFAEEAYKIDMSGLNLSQLNRAITSGTEGGIFVLPKGPSGKVKLAPKARPLTTASKENSRPPSKIAPVKVVVPTAKKPIVAPKKVLAGKATTTKKATSPSKRGAAKKAVTGSKPAAKARAAATKKVPVKKAVSTRKVSVIVRNGEAVQANDVQ